MPKWRHARSPIFSCISRATIHDDRNFPRHDAARGGPTIARNAQGDVVPPGTGWTHDPYGAKVVNDAVHGATMYGRGVAVSKSDFATYAFSLLALRELAAHDMPLNGSVELHLT